MEQVGLECVGGLMTGELAHQPPDSGEGDGLLGDVCLPRPLTALNGVPGQQDPRLDWCWPRSSPAVPAGVCSLFGVQPLILAWLSPRGCLQCRLSPLTLTHPLKRQSEPRVPTVRSSGPTARSV